MEQTLIDHRLNEQLQKLSIQNLIKLIKGCNEKTIRVTDIARGTGYSKGNVYKWERGVIPNNSSEVREVLTRYWMENCKVLMSAKDQEELVLRLERAKHNSDIGTIWNEPLPTYDLNSVFISIPIKDDGKVKVYQEGKAGEGTITFVDGEPALIVIQRDSYFTGYIDGQISVRDDSMEPEFKKGSIIGIRKLEYRKDYNSGSYYLVIDKNLHVMFRKLIRLSDDDVKLEPLNTNCDTLEKKIDDIRVIFKVEGNFIKR